MLSYSGEMPSTFVTAFAGFATVYGFLWALLHMTQDAREPPAIGTTIPFITPLMRMGRRGFRYWTSESRLPIYTLRMPGVRLYIVNATSVIPLVQRKARNISFGPVIVWMAKTLMGVSDAGFEIASHAPYEDHGFAIGTAKTIHPTLAPGPKLDALNRTSVTHLAAALDSLARKQSSIRLRLYEWISYEAMMATTEGIYGPKNPFRDSKFRSAWFEYEPGVVPLMVNVLPQLTARKYIKARQVLRKGYNEYFSQRSYGDPATSAFTKERVRFLQGRGLSVSDIAIMEAAVSIGVLGNTMPATFWILYHVFSDPAVLADCREELSRAVQEQDGVCTVDLAFVKSSCPILLSTFKEIFRFRGISVATRVIGEDQIINDQYLLKKGSILLIPATVQHSRTDVWGENVDDFYHKRHVQAENGRKRPDPVAFRGFGGGSTLCPGRHFAATEVLAFAALIILRFDIEPVEGQWKTPTVENSNLGIAIHKPDQDVEIEIRPRDSKEWVVKLSDSETALEFAAEDMAEKGAH